MHTYYMYPVVVRVPRVAAVILLFKIKYINERNIKRVYTVREGERERW